MIALRGLHPQVRERAELTLAWANQYGIRPYVTSGYRSWTEQAQLRQKYLSGQSRFPANAPGDSAHQYGLAFDSALPNDIRNLPGADEWWAAVREAYGFKTYANDGPHAEVPGWRQFV